MNQFLHGVARAVFESFVLPGPVVEIGSYQVAGQEDIADVRGYFPHHGYTGIDIRHGPGVDLVASVEDLPFTDQSVGTVIALNTFEHVARFWRGLEEIHRVLQPGGALLITCPFWFHIHNHPSDYWRFTPEALEVLLDEYPSRILGRQGPAKKPLHVWALAFRSGRTITATEFTAYQQRLRRYAREPVRWPQHLRYLVGRWIAGRRPFVPYFDQNLWETQCHPPFPPEVSIKPSESAPTVVPSQ